MRAIFALAAVAFALVGCNTPTELSNEDVEKQRKEFSQENYEKALKDQGKTAELEAEKKSEAERAGERDR